MDRYDPRKDLALRKACVGAEPHTEGRSYSESDSVRDHRPCR